MKTTSDNVQSRNNSTQASLTSKLSQIGLRLTMAATLSALAVSGLSNDCSAQEQSSARQAALEHPGWVQVPGELIRPDCVHEIPKGATVEVENGHVTGDVTLNGTFIAHYDACPEEAVITRPRHAHTENTGGVPCGNVSCAGGWVEASQWNPSLGSSDDIDLMWGVWTVPPVPTTASDGGLIFLWNGIEDSSELWVLQPVLQYGETFYKTGGNYWAIASWFIENTNVFYSGPEKVNPGDSIFGYTEIIGTSGSTLDWKVNATDLTTGAYSWIKVGTSGLHWTWAFGGVLEAYNITECSQFPSSGTEVFYDYGPYHGYPDFNAISPLGWYGKQYDWVEGPNCGFKVSLSGDNTTLSF